MELHALDIAGTPQKEHDHYSTWKSWGICRDDRSCNQQSVVELVVPTHATQACPLWESFDMYCCPMGMSSDTTYMNVSNMENEGLSTSKAEYEAQRRTDLVLRLVRGVAV